MVFSQPVSDIVRRRYSCRSYDRQADSEALFRSLGEFITGLTSGPFGAPNRFSMIMADGEDRGIFRRLGTYGAIKDPAGFIIGASRAARMDMEDFGYRLELIVLKATELGLGTCWLGGSFTRGSFSHRINAARGETLPAVISVGIPAQVRSAAQVDQLRKRAAWSELFFLNDFDTPLEKGQAGAYAESLEMVRLAPSAKNYQPWRVIRQAEKWHFYMQRNKGYREFVVPALTGIADLQRMDMGIAMAHFELTAREAGLSGGWGIADPGISLPNKLTEYSVTWSENG
ncbi:MAG: nitroreductase [Leptolinea sp.]|jgi:hypothetical protein|nr:nitroreductase [Leptolinea sp.]